MSISQDYEKFSQKILEFLCTRERNVIIEHHTHDNVCSSIEFKV